MILDRALDVVLDILIVTVAVIAAFALVPPPSTRQSGPVPGPEPAALEAAIARLRVGEPAAAAPYDRAQFPHWLEITAGCDTRCVVLDRQRSPAGWLSAYDGYVAARSAELEIDHVVPLAEAWLSGASEWTLARRRAFANDLDGGELIAVSSWSNRDKGASDPARWRPPDPGWWCAYADAWVGVKLRWDLSADLGEVVALRDMAERC